MATKKIKKVPVKKRIKKVAKKSRVEKPYNQGTMSSSAFFGMIRSCLRQKSRWWKPIMKVKNDAKIPYVGTNKRRKFSYVCSECFKEFDSKQVAVHHKIECGTLKSFDDIPAFVKKLFCEEDGLILLCGSCHDKYHKK